MVRERDLARRSISNRCAATDRSARRSRRPSLANDADAFRSGTVDRRQSDTGYSVGVGAECSVLGARCWPCRIVMTDLTSSFWPRAGDPHKNQRCPGAACGGLPMIDYVLATRRSSLRAR
jgi:hypothetical protein